MTVLLRYWKAFAEGFACGINPRVSMAWLLFAMGCCCYLLLRLNEQREGWVAFWHEPYQRLMKWSQVVQGDRRCGPWGDAQ